MTGVALALAASLSWGIADFGGGIGTRRVQVVWVLLVSQLAGLALVGALALATLPQPPTGRELAWGAFGGAMGAVGLGSFYRALAIGSMGIVGPISATGAIVPVAYGLARGERPSVLQAVGIIVAVGGVVAASLEPLPEGEGRKIATGVRWRSSRRWASARRSSVSTACRRPESSGGRCRCGSRSSRSCASQRCSFALRRPG